MPTNALHVELPVLSVGPPGFQSTGSGTIYFHDGSPAGVYRLRYLGAGDDPPGPSPNPPEGIAYKFEYPGGDSWGDYLDITHPGGAQTTPFAVKADGAMAPHLGEYHVEIGIELL